MGGVTDHFRRTWARPEHEFVKAEAGSIFYLEAVLTEKEQEEMQSFLRDETKIEEVSRSRDDMSANGIDGISTRVIKRAGAEGVQFVRIVVRGILKVDES
jgi:hypothetical protein